MTEAGSSSDATSRYIIVSGESSFGDLDLHPSSLTPSIDIRCFNLPGDAAKYWVVLTMAGAERKTALSERTQNPTWSEDFSQ